MSTLNKEHSLTLIYYHGHGSPYAWRVWLALEHKGLAYELKIISFKNRDNHKPEFLALNPRHKVPVLVDHQGGVPFVLYESQTILEYLEDRFPGPTPERALYPSDIHQRALVRRMAREIEVYLGGKGMDPLVEQYFFTKPENRRADVCEAALAVVAKEFAFWEERLSNKFLSGDTVSAADITLYPLVAMLLRIEQRYPDVTVRQLLGPKLAAWLAAFEAQPYVAKTWPPHWQ